MASGVVVEPLTYSIEYPCPVPWNVSQESQLHADYPLSTHDSPESFAIRRYLETLWLPESISPFSHLIRSLRRIRLHDTSLDGQHPLHAILDLITLSSRAASDKYLVELPQILASGGGEGEEEELMMWYAWNHEKYDGESSMDGEGKADEDEAWKKRWMGRLEQREAMIQTLLLLLKLSLLGPCPPFVLSMNTETSPTKHRRRGRTKKVEPIVESAEERLEHYMDKLSMWQLTDSLDSTHPLEDVHVNGKTKQKDDRHWTQSFCEDAVAPLFQQALPDAYALLHTKLFPHSPFSDDETDDRSSSPSRTLKRTNSTMTQTSDNSHISRACSRAGSMSRGLPTNPETSHDRSTKSRSRSLSVSLAQDEDAQKKNLVEPKRSRMLSREVSMSRVFKEKERQTKGAFKKSSSSFVSRTKSTAHTRVKKLSLGRTLVEETPVKRPSLLASTSKAHIPLDDSPSKHRSAGGQYAEARALTFVEDTPVKKRRRTSESSTPGLFPEAASYTRNSTITESPKAMTDSHNDWDDDDNFLDSFGSPDVLLLSSDGLPFGDDMDDAPPSPLGQTDGGSAVRRLFVPDTPVKKR